MSEDPPTISGYMRQLADQVRVRWQRREPASHLALSPPVVPPATSNSAFPHLSEVQLQRLFGEESASTLARDVFNTLQEMESACAILTQDCMPQAMRVNGVEPGR